LFELLSLAGEYDRAEKHLDVVAALSTPPGRGGTCSAVGTCPPPRVTRLSPGL
jgi:hypothetical protein